MTLSTTWPRLRSQRIARSMSSCSCSQVLCPDLPLHDVEPILMLNWWTDVARNSEDLLWDFERTWLYLTLAMPKICNDFRTCSPVFFYWCDLLRVFLIVPCFRWCHCRHFSSFLFLVARQSHQFHVASKGTSFTHWQLKPLLVHHTISCACCHALMQLAEASGFDTPKSNTTHVKIYRSL